MAVAGGLAAMIHNSTPVLPRPAVDQIVRRRSPAALLTKPAFNRSSAPDRADGQRRRDCVAPEGQRAAQKSSPACFASAASAASTLTSGCRSPASLRRGEAILFDCGWPWSGRALAASLAELGCGPGDLRAIAVTHGDFDHVGPLAALIAEGRAEIIAHELEAPRLASGRWRTLPGNGTSLDPMILAAGPAYRLWPPRPVQVTRPIQDGAAIGDGWIAVHTPGHTPGHTAFFHPATKVLIAGDALGSERRGICACPSGSTPKTGRRRSARCASWPICNRRSSASATAASCIRRRASCKRWRNRCPLRTRHGRDWRVVKALLIVLLIASVTIALVTGAFLLARSPWADSLLEPRADADGIVQRVQSLSRLETTRYTIETVVTADEQGFIDTPLGRLQIGSDRLLMIIHGRVTAGIDLEKLRPQDVAMSGDGKRLTIQLPAVEIFGVDLDNDKDARLQPGDLAQTPEPESGERSPAGRRSQDPGDSVRGWGDAARHRGRAAGCRKVRRTAGSLGLLD